MSTKVRAVANFVSVVGGAMCDSPLNLGIVEPRGRLSRQRGNLYVLVEAPADGPGADVIYPDIVDVVGEQYYSSARSVTGGLLSGLRAANAYVLDQNRQSPHDQRLYPGLTCAVLKEEELFVVQTGPSLVYLVRDGHIERFPKESPWLAATPPEDPEVLYLPPLGVRKDLEPALHHGHVQAGDCVVLAYSSLTRLARPDGVVSAVAQKDLDSAKSSLRALVGHSEFSAIVIQLAGPRAPTPKASTPSTSPVRPPIPRSTPREEVAKQGAKLPPEFVSEPDEYWEEEEETWDEEEAPGERPERPPRPSVSLEDVASGAREGLLKGANTLVTTLKRVLPEPGEVEMPRPSEERAAPRVSTRTLVILSLLIPLLVAILVVVTRYQYDRARVAEHGDYLAEARVVMAEAMRANDTTVIREGLREASNLVKQALQLSPQDDEALRLWWDVQDQLDVINHVARLHTFISLAQLPGSAEATERVGRVIVRGSDVYLLDRSTSQLFSYQMNETGDGFLSTSDPVLVQREDQIGDIVVDDLIELVWMSEGGARTTSNLMLLERGGSLLEITLGVGIRVFPVANAAEWRKVQAAGAYRGNFYVLDPLANRILKYVPGLEGYTTAPEDYIKPEVQIDLAGAVDMDIDGNIYILLADGRIFKFLSGELREFNQVGLDMPLKSPAALQATGGMEGGHIYVADTGNRRIVQFSKEGEFLRQFWAAEGSTEMDKLRGLFVDEERGRVFMINGNSLLVSPIPASAATP